MIADGGYDRSSSRDAIKEKKAKALISLIKNARYRESDSERDQAIAAIRSLGGDKEAKSIWGKLSGYSQRVFVESFFFVTSGYLVIDYFQNALINNVLRIQRVVFC